MQEARGDTWPTPTSRDFKDGGYCENVPVNALLGRAVWPTPTGGSKEKASCPGLDGGAYSRKMLDDVIGEEARKEITGSLNPAWVETLMGYPIGYTMPEGEAMRGLPGVWPQASKDGEWPTPSAQEPGWKNITVVDKDGNTPTHSRQRWYDADSGRIVQKGLQQVVERQGWPAGLGAPQHGWEPPRLTTVKENRAARLKALGNSIVPQVAARWFAAISEE